MNQKVYHIQEKVNHRRKKCAQKSKSDEPPLLPLVHDTAASSTGRKVSFWPLEEDAPVLETPSSKALSDILLGV